MHDEAIPLPAASETEADTPVTQALFLVGGLGTRLGALTASCPKPLLPVCGRPFLESLLHLAASQGVREAVLLAGYRADQVADFFAPGGPAQLPPGLRVRLLQESEPLGTGGALRQALATEGLNEHFFLLNGDSVAAFPFQDLGPLPSSLAGRLAAVRLDRNDRYGELELEGERILRFRERPARPGSGPESGPQSGVINAGVYLLHRDSLRAALARVHGPSLEKDLFPVLAQEGRLGARVFSCPFLDMGTPPDYNRAQETLRALFQQARSLPERGIPAISHAKTRSLPS